jgi:hypothetical protein
MSPSVISRHWLAGLILRVTVAGRLLKYACRLLEVDVTRPHPEMDAARARPSEAAGYTPDGFEEHFAPLHATS